MNSSLGIGKIVYPYGNTARVEIIESEFAGRFKVRYLEDCIAKLGWRRFLLLEKGYEVWIAKEQLHDRPTPEYV